MHATCRNARLPGLPFILLTLGGYRASAKLQKEHTFGHGKSPCRFCHLRPFAGPQLPYQTEQLSRASGALLTFSMVIEGLRLHLAIFTRGGIHEEGHGMFS